MNEGQQYRKICVVGLGYIGLPTASLLATKGFHVKGVDTNPRIVNSLNEGEVIIQEPSLDVLVKSAVNSGHLTAGLAPEPADVFIIAVPTPFKENHAPDLSYVQKATETLAEFLRPGNLVILESTSPVGTTESVASWIKERRPDLLVSGRAASSKSQGKPIFVAHCPERVLPGQILHELVHNDRIVGGIDQASTDVAVEFYREFVAGKILASDSRTAEMSKLTENIYRDVNIALANELSLICERMGIDVWELIELANHHPRVNILRPGPGVGGHCIAVDPWFVVDSVPDLSRLIRTAREVNDSKPGHVVKKVKEAAKAFKNPVIACLGLAYKPDVDDLRESPAIQIVEELHRGNVGKLIVVEPFIDALPKELSGLSGIQLTNLHSALEQADIIVILVGHSEFRNAKPENPSQKALIDTTGTWR